jgi:hypothetical protein
MGIVMSSVRAYLSALNKIVQFCWCDKIDNMSKSLGISGLTMDVFLTQPTYGRVLSRVVAHLSTAREDSAHYDFLLSV